MGFFKRLFGGEGKFRFEGEALNENGDLRNFSAAMPFEGSPSSEEEIVNLCVNHLLVDKGHRVKKIRIIGGYGNYAPCEISGREFHYG